MSAALPHRESAAPPRRRGFAWRLVAAFAALALVAILVLTLLFADTYKALLARELDERLRAAASAVSQLAARDWPAGPDASLQAIIQKIGQSSRVRLTLIAVDGRVLADSDRPDIESVTRMENHRNRVEFREALRTGVGDARHPSPTVGTRQEYRAVRVDRDGKPLGVVRASYPAEKVDAEVAALGGRMALIGGGAAAIVVALAAWVIARATRPLRELSAAGDALLAGRYDHRFPTQLREGAEFAGLAKALAEASGRLARGERQLRSTSQTQATVLEGMTESVIAVDRGERVLFANASAGRLLGFRPETVEGLPLLEAVRSHELRDVVQRALRSKRLSSCELAWRSGSQRTFDVLATPLPGDPSPGVVLVLRDVSEVRRLERMRQQFVANVSHELKTPLSSIKAYTETLLGGARNDPVHCERFLNRIDEQAGRLQDLILDMLSLARIESGQLALELADVSVAHVVRRCIADYEPHAVGRELVLENLVDDPTIRVHADEEALRQILSNLIDNAVKYTPAGGRVSIRCHCSGAMAEIDVSDTGIGIPPEHHAHVFERFYRVDKARSRELGGTGLGLSIVKHLSQAMGGSVSVRSAVQAGSTFSVRLPLATG